MDFDRQKLLELASTAHRESRHLDFKREFAVESNEAWCELIKDIIAFANTGGGIIIFGVENDGSKSDADCAAVLDYDLADVTNKIFKYTGCQFAEIEIAQVHRAGTNYPVLIVSPSDVPIVFIKPGSYDVGGGKQKTAFSQGSVYFRHGAKSEPGNHDDLTSWRDREIKRVRSSWMNNIRKVVRAPPGHAVSIVPPKKLGGEGQAVTVSGYSKDGVGIRITNDPHAPGVREETILEQYPLTYGRLVRLLKKRYADFEQNRKFHGIKAKLQSNKKYCTKRLLDPGQPRGSSKFFYSEAVLSEFDKYYTRK